MLFKENPVKISNWTRATTWLLLQAWAVLGFSLAVILEVKISPKQHHAADKVKRYLQAKWVRTTIHCKVPLIWDRQVEIQSLKLAKMDTKCLISKGGTNPRAEVSIILDLETRQLRTSHRIQKTQRPWELWASEAIRLMRITWSQWDLIDNSNSKILMIIQCWDMVSIFHFHSHNFPNSKYQTTIF